MALDQEVSGLLDEALAANCEELSELGSYHQRLVRRCSANLSSMLLLYKRSKGLTRAQESVGARAHSAQFLILSALLSFFTLVLLALQAGVRIEQAKCDTMPGPDCLIVANQLNQSTLETAIVDPEELAVRTARLDQVELIFLALSIMEFLYTTSWSTCCKLSSWSSSRIVDLLSLVVWVLWVVITRFEIPMAGYRRWLLTIATFLRIARLSRLVVFAEPVKFLERAVTTFHGVRRSVVDGVWLSAFLVIFFFQFSCTLLIVNENNEGFLSQVLGDADLFLEGYFLWVELLLQGIPVDHFFYEGMFTEEPVTNFLTCSLILWCLLYGLMLFCCAFFIERMAASVAFTKKACASKRWAFLSRNVNELQQALEKAGSPHAAPLTRKQVKDVLMNSGVIFDSIWGDDETLDTFLDRLIFTEGLARVDEVMAETMRYTEDTYELTADSWILESQDTNATSQLSATSKLWRSDVKFLLKAMGDISSRAACIAQDSERLQACQINANVDSAHAQVSLVKEGRAAYATAVRAIGESRIVPEKTEAFASFGDGENSLPPAFEKQLRAYFREELRSALGGAIPSSKGNVAPATHPGLMQAVRATPANQFEMDAALLAASSPPPPAGGSEGAPPPTTMVRFRFL